jgi:serine/threonine protein kinase
VSATPCPDDHELLAVASGEEATPDLRGHLETCSQCRQRLEQLRAEVSNLRAALCYGDVPAAEPGSDAAPALSPPAAIGKYIVLDVLGRGGQADVYRALHTALGKEVVIKLSRRPLGPGQADRDRLLAEGKLLAELDHPCMARVYDADSYEGHPYLVMEYVRGPTLRQHVEGQRPRPRQAAALVAQLARALAVAHRHGVVHQDLKPKNILIDEAGRPRVIDFGMARLVHGWADRRAQPEGGTVAYMAPEQARGEVERIDARSDIFALGAVLYYLLVGRPPFQGHDRLEELQRAERCDFDRRALRAARVPPRLEAICLRAMAPDPADRHARAEDLAADLEGFVRRPRRVAVLTCLAAGILLAWAVWKLLPPPPPVPDSRPVPQPVVELPPDALSLRLRRNNKIYEPENARALRYYVPLRRGDALQVSAPAPAGLHAALFLIDRTGVRARPVVAAPGEVLTWPGPTRWAPLDDKPGTEVLLVCWRRTGPVEFAQVQHLWGTEQALPDLPRDVVLHLDRDRIKAFSPARSYDPPQTFDDPEGQVRNRLERLRRQLCERVDALEGIAFYHQVGP